LLAHVNVADLLGTVNARWLVIGCAGFIGSNLGAALLGANQTVVGLDNLSTGHYSKVDWLKRGAFQHGGQFEFLGADVTDADSCLTACRGVDYVLHQAALGSVPRSIQTPLLSHASNVDEFVKILDSAKVMGVRRFESFLRNSFLGLELMVGCSTFRSYRIMRLEII
jgi:UDP-N-acetylglucosamine/UDP-N-acetylgalactosamine 4-epimerase